MIRSSPYLCDGLVMSVRPPPPWAYGITTVPERRYDLLPRTIHSLARGGFDLPRLFIDGHEKSYHEWDTLPQTIRYPAIRTMGNWLLGLWELYIREPAADRYAIFQDDCVC